MPEQPHYSITPLETLRHFGLLKTLRLIILMVLHIRPVAVMRRVLRPNGGTKGRDTAIRRATPDDGDLFEAAGFAPGMLKTKLAEGPGWILVVEDRLVAWNFLALSQSTIADWLVLRSSSPTAIWASGTWVHRDYRGRGLLRQFADVGDDWRIAEGFREVLCWIDMTNYASLHGTLRLGSRKIGRVTVLRAFGIALVHDGRRWHLGRWSAARPLVLSVEDICRDLPRSCAGETPPDLAGASRGRENRPE